VQPVDIAGAVREDPLGADAHDQLGTRELGQQRVVVRDARRTAHPHPVWILEINEEQADLRIDQNVAQALKHAVPVIVWECQSLLIDDPNKAGYPALVRDVRLSLGIGGRQEEHAGPRYQLAVSVGEAIV